MNIVVLLVDSLRAASLGSGAQGPTTPFFDWLSKETISFHRAYATECWTLPTHMSIFTGLLPSQHDAHFLREQLPETAVAAVMGHLSRWRPGTAVAT